MKIRFDLTSDFVAWFRWEIRFAKFGQTDYGLHASTAGSCPYGDVSIWLRSVKSVGGTGNVVDHLAMLTAETWPIWAGTLGALAFTIYKNGN